MQCLLALNIHELIRLGISKMIFNFLKMKKTVIVLLVFIIACSSPTEQKKANNKLKGDWAFLDKRGNYNEAFFGDSVFFTYNKINGKMPDFKYKVVNDSLYSNFEKPKPALSRIAGIKWISENRVILSTEFVHDTLEPISESGFLLSNTNFKKDSAKFVKDHFNRYEAFLIKRGILSADEVRDFKEKGIVPEDLKKK
jgi:hypothetical protein